MHFKNLDTLEKLFSNKCNLNEKKMTDKNITLSSKDLGNKIVCEIETNNATIISVKKTFNNIQRFLKTDLKRQTIETEILFLSNLGKTMEEVSVTKGKLQKVEKVACDTLERLYISGLEQKSNKNEDLSLKQLDEAMEDLIDFKSNIAIENEKIFYLLMKEPKNNQIYKNETGLQELKNAVFKIFAIREKAIRTTKMDLNVFSKLIQETEINLSLKKSLKVIKALEAKKEAVILAKNALNELKRQINITEEDQRNKKVILTPEELRHLVVQIEETTFQVEEGTKTIFIALQEPIEVFEIQRIEENSFYLSDELHELMCEKIEVWREAADTSTKIYNAMHEILLREENNRKTTANELDGPSEKIKKARYEVVEAAKTVFKHLKNQRLMDVENEQHINENNILFTDKVFNELMVEIKETKKESILSYNIFKELTEEEEKQQTELKYVNNVLLQTIEAYFRLVIPTPEKFATNDSFQETFEMFKKSAWLYLYSPLLYCFTNISLHPTQSEDKLQKLIDQSLKFFSYFLKEALSCLPPLKELVKKEVDKTLRIIMGLLEKRLRLSNALLKIDDFAAKLIEALNTISRGQEAKNKLFKLTKNTYLETLEIVEAIEIRMTRLLVELENEFEKSNTIKNESVAIDFTKELASGQESIEKLEKANIKLQLLTMELKNNTNVEL